MSSCGPSLFVTYSGLSGGAGRFMVDVVAALPGAAVIACPPGPVAEAAREAGVPVVELPERRLELRGSARSALRAARDLAGHGRDISRLVRELEPDLLVTWGMRSTLAAGRPDLPWIARHHDFVPDGRAGAAVRRALKRPDVVVVNSRAVAEGLALNRELEVIHPGVDLERFRPPPAPPPPPPLVLWLGAIVGWKRPDLVLAAARELPDVEFRLAGAPLDTAGEQLLAALTAEAGGNVTLAGQVDPAAALREAHVLLHTADREPFGIAVAEALAAGVPVVAPAADGPAEIVDGGCGRLYQPGDAVAAAAAVREVLERRDELSAGARRRAAERLDLERARSRFAELVDAHRRPHPRLPGEGIALVTVSHDSGPELAALLRSAARHLPGASVIVADSGSSDDSADVARAHGAHVIELDNVGYGPAANAGVAEVADPVTVVMNADVELVDSSLAELARTLTPERIAAPAVLLPDGRRQDVGQPEPATLPLVVFALLPPALLPPALRVRLEPWRASRPRRVGWLVGACVAARTETLRRLGPFDPDAFMYAEDLDLGLRAADSGVETWFWPDARVLHKRAHSTRRAFGGEPFERLARRRREVIAERRGQRRLRLDDALQAVTFLDRIILKTLARRDATRERRQLAALRAVRRSP